MTDIIKSREVQRFNDASLPISSVLLTMSARCPECDAHAWTNDVSHVGPIAADAKVSILDALFICRECGHEESRLFKLEEMDRGEGIEGLVDRVGGENVPADHARGPDDRDDGSV